MLDLGCGYGYSTLAFALMVDLLLKHEPVSNNCQFSIIGVDLYSDFIEKSIINYDKYRKSIENTHKITIDF
jgi:hypothetical protein